MHCHGSRNCCSGPTGSPSLLVSLKIAVLWWCTGDCWENSCPTPPLLLHPSFPLNGAISSNTLGSGPQKSRRLRPIAQINWHEWAYPHAASVKESGYGSMRLHYCNNISLAFAAKQWGKIEREWCNAVLWDSTKGFCSTYVHIHSQPLLRETPQCTVLTLMQTPSHAGCARVSKVLDQS